VSTAERISGLRRKTPQKEKRAKPVHGLAHLIFRRGVSPSVCPSLYLYPWEAFPCLWTACPLLACLSLFPVGVPQDALPVPGGPRDAPPDDQQDDRQDVQLV
jgi:hypothetical protein